MNRDLYQFKTKIPITRGLTELQTYQLAATSVLLHGNIVMSEDRRLDPSYTSAVSEIKYSFSHLAFSTMEDTKESRDLSSEINNKLVQGLFSGDDKVASASIEQIKRRNTFVGKIHIAKEVGLLLGNPLSDLIKGGATSLKSAFNAAISSTVTKLSVENKLRDYLLNLSHEVGGSKAKWFKDKLGFTVENMDGLAKQIKFDASTAVKVGETQFGTKYNQVIRLTGANGTVREAQFTWIINKDGYTRLITGVPVHK